MKKTIAMLLAAAMTASLAACSSGAPAAATTAAPAATTAATTAAQTTAAPAASEAPAAETKAAETTAAAAEEYKPTWPKKTVTFTVPAAPGGGTDLAARVIAEYMQRVTGQAFNVNNDTSGGNMAALEKARHFKKDGYDLLFYHNNIILSWYQGKLNFNPMEEYTFVDTVSGTGAGPMVVLPTAPYQAEPCPYQAVLHAYQAGLSGYGALYCSHGAKLPLPSVLVSVKCSQRPSSAAKGSQRPLSAVNCGFSQCRYRTFRP